MKNNKQTVRWLLSLLFITSMTCVQARVVVAKEKQNDVLQSARLLLSAPAEKSTALDGPLKDPFHKIREEEPVEVVVEEVAVVETVHQLSDSEILNLAAQRLKPSGFIDQGGQQYLILNGRKVQDGVSFNFPHEEKRYAIEITQIQTSSFTLNLNSASKTISTE